jgi:hypothetical protein
MAIDGTMVKAASFWDEDSHQFVEINLSVRDIILFRLLERISRKNG